MDKILILYFSGAGNTRYVAERIYSEVRDKCTAEICSIEDISPDTDLSLYDRLVIGTSTIHSEPPQPMKLFLGSLPRLNEPKPAFIYATYGLYPENVLRVLSELCVQKNIIPVYHSGYRCRATDGVLLAPYIKAFSKNEKDMEQKIQRDADAFLKINDIEYRKPGYKWYTLLNLPNKLAGQHFHFRIYLLKDICVKCGKCIRNCPVHAISADASGYPDIKSEKCINCYRCIHKCPCTALSLSKSKSPEITFK